MTEEIIRYFKLGTIKNEGIFIQAFQDIVFDFVSSNNADINSFLSWWEDVGVKKSISTPEAQNAIRILTIHKSKGLDFKSVIIPFCDWSFAPKIPPMLWCKPETEPFNKIELLPIPYSDKLENTIFKNDYYEEKLHSFVDNLNLAYVAFTRAVHSLHIFAPDSNGDKNTSISDLLKNILKKENLYKTEQGNKLLELNKHWNADNLCFEIGEYIQAIKNEEKNKSCEIKTETYISNRNLGNLQLRLRGINYFGEKQEKINYGNIMHELLKRIITIDDIDKAISEMIFNGSINQDDRKEITDKIVKFISQEDTKKWFSGYSKTLNETDIIQPQGNIYRPDRVLIDNKHAIIIDYKFGEKEENKYQKQVKSYMDLISQMGYSVEGYICYVALNKTTKI
jgi:ATP-dependent exoDNAse (exonuclease V) beta subunit